MRRAAASSPGEVAPEFAAALACANMRREFKCAEGRKQKDGCTEQAGVADPAHEELLLGGKSCGRPVSIEQKQPSKSDAGRQPRADQLRQIARNDEREHRGQREGEQLEEPALVGIPGEVVAAEAQHHDPDERDQHEHDGRQGVEVHREPNSRPAQGLGR